MTPSFLKSFVNNKYHSLVSTQQSPISWILMAQQGGVAPMMPRPLKS